jgi:flagellar biosynthesis/type III secretory pathway chaperone
MTSTAQTSSDGALGDRLSLLVDRAQSLVNQLDALSASQSEAISSGQVEQIIELVTTREPLVSEIVTVGEEIGAILSDPEFGSRLNEQVHAQTLDQISQIESVMHRLRDRDAQDQKRMETTRDELAGQLVEMGSAQSALRAYSGRSGTPNPILQDRQG